MSSDDDEVPPPLLSKKKQIDLAAAKRKWHIETHSSKPEPKEEQEEHEEQEEQEYDDQPCVRFGQGRGKGADILETLKRSAAANSSFKPIQDEEEGEDDASGLIDSFTDKLDEPVAPHSACVRRSSVDSTSTISSLANELNEATSFMMAVSHPADIKMAIGIRDALNELDFSTEDGRTEAIHLTKKLRQKLRPRPTPACRECMNLMRECICKRAE